MVDRLPPFRDDLLWLDVRVARLCACAGKDRRYSLLHEGVLIAANEKYQFREGIRAHVESQPRGGFSHGYAESRMLAATCNYVLDWPQQGKIAIYIDVRYKAVLAHSRVMGKII